MSEKTETDRLIISGLSFHYGEQAILDSLSLNVRDGEFVSILGPSGCGKSTILKLLTGELTPEAGEILVGGEPVHGISEHFAYMPQNDLLFPWKTILDNVCLYGQIHGTRKEMEEKARELFPVFGLEGYENSYPGSLSGGMRQRAAFLRTAMCAADILLLDEPFGALDVITRGNMQDWLLGMRRKLDKTVVLVTHDMEEAIYLSDRILIITRETGEGAKIAEEFRIDEENRSRAWLYRQSELKNRIYDRISGKKEKET